MGGKGFKRPPLGMCHGVGPTQKPIESGVMFVTTAWNAVYGTRVHCTRENYCRVIRRTKSIQHSAGFPVFFFFSNARPWAGLLQSGYCESPERVFHGAFAVLRGGGAAGVLKVLNVRWMRANEHPVKSDGRNVFISIYATIPVVPPAVYYF